MCGERVLLGSFVLFEYALWFLCMRVSYLSRCRAIRVGSELTRSELVEQVRSPVGVREPKSEHVRVGRVGYDSALEAWREKYAGKCANEFRRRVADVNGHGFLDASVGVSGVGLELEQREARQVVERLVAGRLDELEKEDALVFGLDDGEGGVVLVFDAEERGLEFEGGVLDIEEQGLGLALVIEGGHLALA